MSEDIRYKVYRIGAHLAWWSAFAWSGALTYINLSQDGLKPPSDFQKVSGLGIILLIGVAIALGSALSRMRLANTINRVFEAGMKIAYERQEELRKWTHQQEDGNTRQIDSSTT